MCFICDQQSGFETDLSKILQLNKNPNLEISANSKTFQSSDLIGEVTNAIESEFAGKENIYYYIDDSYGVKFPDLWGPYESTEPHEIGEQKFIENVFKSIDPYIELDFYRTYSKSESNIDIYYIGDWSEGYTGYAHTGDLTDSNVDIFWEKTSNYSIVYENIADWELPYGSLKDDDAMTLIHEIGHAIGLSHPQLNGVDDPNGDWHDTDDTVMSYNFIYNENLSYAKAPSWRPADIAALQSIWGVETENTPTSISLSSTNFNENIQANTSIATLSTTDVDVNDTFTYTLVSGVGDTDNSYFTINGSSLKINSSPDYELKSSYTIRIKTTDSGNNSFEKSFTLSVNDLNETSPSGRPATSIELQQLFIAYFSRPSDPIGLDYWTNKGISRSAFAANMYLQPEFNNVNSDLSVEAQVNQIYLNLFSREADIAGLTYWAKQIRNGVLQLASIANDLVWAAENNSGSSNDKTTLTNKTNAAVAYTAKIRESTSSILAYQAQSTNPWITGNNLTEAKNYISGIDLYNAHTSWGIENSIAKFSRLSASYNYKLAIDSSKSNVDIITGIETNIHAANTFKVADNEINPFSSETLDNDYLLDIDHQTFISNLYEEVLDREPDSIGMNYWTGQLNSGAETGYEVLLGFTESAEYKSLFPEPTVFG